MRLRLRHIALMGAVLLIAARAGAVEFRYSQQKAKSVGLPGFFGALADPASDEVYTADAFPFGEAFAFAMVLDTGASGSMLSWSDAGTDGLNIPTTGETYDDVGIGGIETFDVSVPTRLLLAPVSIGEDAASTNLDEYTSSGDYKFQIRQSDPMLLGFPISVNVAGMPLLSQHVMHVKPNSTASHLTLIPTVEYLDTELLPALPADLPSEGVLHLPLVYRNFVEPGAPVDVADNPLLPGVRVVDQRKGPQQQSAPSDWLFDTGASLTVVGEDLAAAIGIDPDTEAPLATVPVLGVGGDERVFLGYRVDELIVSMTGGDELIFENIVVFVPEAGSLPADLPGIFGMNLIGKSFSDEMMLDERPSPFSDWYVDPFGSQVVLVDREAVGPSTMTTVRSGDWNADDTWSPAAAPTADHDVKVLEHTVTVAADGEARTLLIGHQSGVVAVDGGITLAVARDMAITAGTLEIAPGGRLDVGTDLLLQSGSTYVCRLDGSENGLITTDPAHGVVLDTGSTLRLEAMDRLPVGDAERTVITSGIVLGEFADGPGPGDHLGHGAFFQSVDYRDMVNVKVRVFGAMAGDVDGDRRFDFADLVAMFSASGQFYGDQSVSDREWTNGDFSGDGSFTFADLVLAFSEAGSIYGSDVPYDAALAESAASFASVPEPGTAVMLLCGLAGLLLLWWRRREGKRCQAPFA